MFIALRYTFPKNNKREFGETYDKKNDNGIMYIYLCVYFSCVFWTTNKSLTLGVNAIITEIDKENKIITTKDSGEDCLIDCSKIPMIYCNYDTQDVVDITLDDLQVGDEIILTIRSSEIENLQKEDDNKGKIAVEQLQLGTQRIR